MVAPGPAQLRGDIGQGCGASLGPSVLWVLVGADLQIADRLGWADGFLCHLLEATPTALGGSREYLARQHGCCGPGAGSQVGM